MAAGSEDRRGELPKAFSDALARRLNRACLAGDGCDGSCAGIGWCGRCWASAASGGRTRPQRGPQTPL